MTIKESRGIRNNNPGNLDYNDDSPTWQGLANPPWEIMPDGSRGRFCRFISPFWGLRALCKTLLTYQRKHGRLTIRHMIERWAPASENNTLAYVAAVSQRMGVEPDVKLPLTDRAVLGLMARAITIHENGTDPYPIEAYVEAADAAMR